MRTMTAFLVGTAAGVGLAYLLQPGARGRRIQARQRSARVVRQQERRAEKRARDLRNRVQGVVARQARPLDAPVPDVVLQERVRANLGHAAHNAHAINVAVKDAHVFLAGPILRTELDGALRRIRAVAGVKDVTSHLFPVDSEDDLQARRGRRPALSLPSGLRSF